MLASQASTLIYPASDREIATAIATATGNGDLPHDIELIDSAEITSHLDATDYTSLTEPWQLDNLSLCIAFLKKPELMKKL